MSSEIVELPVTVRDFPHWRVNIRPAEYDPELITSVQRCVELIRHTTVRFRGWPYPVWNEQNGCSSVGNNWIASWANFWGHNEYWRLYTSGQFLHLFAVREYTNSAWNEKLREATAMHLGHLQDFDVTLVPGFIGVTNLLYTVAEITEFTTRMAQADVYVGPLSVSISLEGVNQFILTTDQTRRWDYRYQASENTIGSTWNFNSDELIADAVTPTVEIIQWIVARFGWLDPSTEFIAREVTDFRKGVV